MDSIIDLTAESDVSKAPDEIINVNISTFSELPSLNDDDFYAEKEKPPKKEENNVAPSEIIFSAAVHEKIIGKKNEKSSTNGEIFKRKTAKKNDDLKTNKNLEREEKRRVTAEKRAAKEEEKRQKREEREAARADQPQNLIKNLILICDTNLKNFVDEKYFAREVGRSLLGDKNIFIPVLFFDCDVPYSINFRFKNAAFENFDDFSQILNSTSPADEFLVVFPTTYFADLIRRENGDNLHSFVEKMRFKKPDSKPIFFLYEFEKYFCKFKSVENRQFVQRVRNEQNFDYDSNSNSNSNTEIFASREFVDETLIDLEMDYDISHFLAEDQNELIEWVRHFCKAVVEKPEKLKKRALADELPRLGVEGLPSKTRVRDPETGASETVLSRRKTWRRMLEQCMQRQDTPFAHAVVEKFACPRALIKAYEECDNVETARNLLRKADEGGRRRFDASRRIHMVFTCRDPSVVLDTKPK